MAKFGTDGIRGLYGKEITHELAFKVGLALAKIKPNAKIVVGRDNRPSGKPLSKALEFGIALGGGTTYDVGVCSTPCISFLVGDGFDFGVMITASHNPPEYNGIKVFGSNGIKTEYGTEQKIENIINGNLDSFGPVVGKILPSSFFKQKYVNFLKLILPKINYKIVVDTSNGASRAIAKKVFGKNVIFVGNKSGKTINSGCGATHPNYLLSQVQKHGADIGFAFDGDADRIVVATQKQIYDGDNILFALCKYFRQTRKIFDTVCATIMSNMALEKQLQKLGIKVVYTDVGDKYVIQKMQQEGLILGGESSGHIIASEFLPTGDGLLCAILLLHAQKFLKESFDELLHFEKCLQHETSFQTKLKTEIMKDKLFLEFVESQKQKIEKNGRIIVRASGTEPKIRIMVESHNKTLCKELANKIFEKAKQTEERLCAE